MAIIDRTHHCRGSAFCSHSAATATAPKKVESEIWAGYAVGGLEEFSSEHASVGGTWEVPTAKCRKFVHYTKYAMWVGLGGTSGNGELAQIGVLANCSFSGKATYVGVYEMHNHPGWKSARKIDSDEYPVQAGDKIQASVGYFASVNANGKTIGNYLLTLRNLTQGWNLPPIQEKGSTALSAHNSAEWILEAVTETKVVPLANFGTAKFTNCTANGKAISDWSKIWKIDLTKPAWNNLVKARTSGLSNGKSFTVTWSQY